LVRLQPLIFWERILVEESSQSRSSEFSRTKHTQFLKAWAAAYSASYGQIFQRESVSSPQSKVAKTEKDLVVKEHADFLNCCPAQFPATVVVDVTLYSYHHQFILFFFSISVFSSVT